MTLRIETRTSPVPIEIWTIDRPAVANALDAATIRALHEAIARVEHQTVAPRGIVLTGASRGPGKRSVFLAGADLDDVAAIGDAAAAGAFAAGMNAILERLESLPTLVVAAIDGDVFGGGCEVVLACDLRIMSSGHRFEFRQTRMGLSAGWGATTRLLHTLGGATAKRLLLTGAPCEADEALRLGLVTEVVAPGETIERAIDWIARAAEGAPKALASIKRCVVELTGRSRSDGFQREIDTFVACYVGDEHREAMAARRERRKPRW
jgi:enoyl-CoA hydratase/carnithine racemase